MTAHKLVYVASQIRKFLATKAKTEGPAAIENHLRKVRHPGIRNQIYAHVAKSSKGFEPQVRTAVESVAASSRTVTT